MQGTVAENCAITNFPSASDLGALAAASSHMIQFDFTCNAPFDYDLSSANGALRHVTQSGVAGFATALAYDVSVALPTDAGAGIHDTCNSADIAFGSVTCGFSSSAGETAINQTGSLTLNWNTPGLGSATPLLAGAYADSLTLTIAALP